MQPFTEKLRRLNGSGLKRRAVDVLQVNLGRYCNLACIHCHVEAGPTRTEMMSRENVDAVLGFLGATRHSDPRYHRRRAGAAPGIRLSGRVGTRAGPAGDRSLQLNGDLRAGERLSAGVFSPAASRTCLFTALLFQRQCRQAARQGNFRRQHPGAADSQRTRLRPAGERLGAQSGLQSRRTALAAAARDNSSRTTSGFSTMNSALSSIGCFA